MWHLLHFLNCDAEKTFTNRRSVHKYYDALQAASAKDKCSVEPESCYRIQPFLWKAPLQILLCIDQRVSQQADSDLRINIRTLPARHVTEDKNCSGSQKALKRRRVSVLLPGKLAPIRVKFQRAVVWRLPILCVDWFKQPENQHPSLLNQYDNYHCEDEPKRHARYRWTNLLTCWWDALGS